MAGCVDGPGNRGRWSPCQDRQGWHGPGTHLRCFGAGQRPGAASSARSWSCDTVRACPRPVDSARLRIRQRSWRQARLRVAAYAAPPRRGNLKYAPGRAATRAWRWGEVRLPGTGTGTGTSHPRSLSRPYARPHENASPRPARKRRQTQTAKRSVRRLIIRGLGLVGQLGMERISPTRTRPSHYFGVSHANALAQFLWVAG